MFQWTYLSYIHQIWFTCKQSKVILKRLPSKSSISISFWLCPKKIMNYELSHNAALILRKKAINDKVVKAKKRKSDTWYKVQDASEYKIQDTKYKMLDSTIYKILETKSNYKLAPSVLPIQFTIRETLIDYSVGSVNQTIINRTANERSVLCSLWVFVAVAR